MTCEPDVSVVMGVYNGAAFLRCAVESVLQQEGVSFELIVIDDGSTDDSSAILDEYAARDSCVRVIHQENAGLTKALIRGCSASRGEFIARQDADDVSLPGRLAALVKLLRGDDRLAFASSQVQVIGPQGELLMTHSRPLDAAEATALLVEGRTGPPGHGSVMFRRRAYQDVGGYRREFYFAQDCDLWLRLAEKGLLGYAPDVLYQYRIAPGSISGNRNPIKTAFAERVHECRALRNRGRSEEPVLAECRALAARRAETSSAAEAATLYFLGRNLLISDPAGAWGYLVQCLRRKPWHGRAWACLAAIPISWACRCLRVSNN